MGGLSRFGANGAKGEKGESRERVRRKGPEPEMLPCPLCGAHMPRGTRICPSCGVHTDESPESLAELSGGPLYPLMKAQAEALKEIEVDVDAIRRLLVTVSAMAVVGFAVLLFLVYYIAYHM